MSCELAVMGLGDVRRSDKGLAIYLIERLEEIFSNCKRLIFINAGKDGRDLYQLLQSIDSKKVIVIDTVYDIINPAEINYLQMKTDGDSIKKLLLITIGIQSDDWGKKLSKVIKEEFDNLVSKVSNVITEFLKK